MTHVINENCVACGQCKGTCPVEAIDEGTPFIIDSEKCIDCGACVSVCPVQAIAPK